MGPRMQHSATTLVSPFRCRMWALHDRLEEHITEDTCKTEIDSFESHGQLVAVAGRPLRGEDGYDFELIFGARRLFVARHLNIPLLVESHAALSDRDAIISMDIENRHRMDISPYERGLSYTQWIRGGHFESQEDISRALKLSASCVSRLVKLARLPSIVVAAFPSPCDIREGWGIQLVDLLEDETQRHSIVQQARMIGRYESQPVSEEVFRQLLGAAATGSKLQAKVHDDVVKDDAGHPLFRIRYQRTTVAILLPAEKVSKEVLLRIKEVVVDVLQEFASSPSNGAIHGSLHAELGSNAKLRAQ
jgi:ParB family transcriptional regulator, chromosome partitioning protein